MSNKQILLKNPLFRNKETTIFVERGTLLENREQYNAEVFEDSPIPVSTFEKIIVWLLIGGFAFLMWSFFLSFVGRAI